MKINPCRCLGNRARIIEIEHENTVFYTVLCPDCNTMIGKKTGNIYFETPYGAVNKWNEWSIENNPRWNQYME